MFRMALLPLLLEQLQLLILKLLRQGKHDTGGPRKVSNPVVAIYLRATASAVAG